MLLEEGPDGQSRFRRSRDFVRLGEIYDDPKAWEALLNTTGREAVQKAEDPARQMKAALRTAEIAVEARERHFGGKG